MPSLFDTSTYSALTKTTAPAKNTSAPQHTWGTYRPPLRHIKFARRVDIHPDGSGFTNWTDRDIMIGDRSGAWGVSAKCKPFAGTMEKRDLEDAEWTVVAKRDESNAHWAWGGPQQGMDQLVRIDVDDPILGHEEYYYIVAVSAPVKYTYGTMGQGTFGSTKTTTVDSGVKTADWYDLLTDGEYAEFEVVWNAEDDVERDFLHGKITEAEYDALMIDCQQREEELERMCEARMANDEKDAARHAHPFDDDDHPFDGGGDFWKDIDRIIAEYDGGDGAYQR